MVLQNAGAATVIEEKDLTDETFIKTVRSYIEDRDKLEKSAENARKLHVADTEERIFSVLKGLIEK
jgi:UDP-N-acetylglucosamine--N-acetylmuramyl-(pentapeptide) pyrophosphoryl-undecaprenol N-acetylglucosamine transferase